MTRTRRRPLALVSLVAWTLTGCAGPGGIVWPGSVPAGGIQSLEISSGDLLPGFDPTADNFSVSSLNTSGDVQIRVDTVSGYTASMGDTPLPSGQWVTFPVAALSKQSSVPIAVTDGEGHSHTYQIAGLPSDFPDYTVTASGTPKPGVVCLAANASDGHPSYLIVTDQLGKPQYYKRLSSTGFDLQRHTAPDGSVRYSYMQSDGPQLNGVATALGAVHLLDGQYHELKSIALLPHGDHGALPADLHDFLYLDDNHYVLLSSEQKQVTNIPSLSGKSGTVSASIIQEVDNGQVTFEWDSTNYPEFYANASDGNDFTDASHPIADYMHMNAICLDPKDGNLIVSFRHQDQIVKLDRRTGAILWRFGGRDSDFALTPEQQFSHQHFARLQPDGSLTLFDNGNATQHTRLLTFKLDETAHTVTSFQAIDPGRYSNAMGSYQPFDADTYFVGWGARTTGTSDVEEVTDCLPTFSLTFDDAAYTSYRALKYLN